MTYTDKELQEIENFASLNYSAEKIAKILYFDKKVFLLDIMDQESPAYEYFNRGQLLTNSMIRKNLVDSAKTSITASQEYAKMIQNDKLNDIKNELSQSTNQSNEAALTVKFNDSMDHYHALTEFINSGNTSLMPAEMAEYWHRLDTAHDLQSKFQFRAKGKHYIVDLLKLKFPDISTATAYRYLHESLNFFSVTMDKAHWRNVLTDDLEKAKTLAWELNRIDWFIKAVKEQAEIQQVKIPDGEQIPIDLLQEKILLIVNDPGLLSPDLKRISTETIISKIKSFDIELADKIRVAKDAGIEDVDFEELFNQNTDESEIS